MVCIEETMNWEEITRASGLREYICDHGVGHPDHMSAVKLGSRRGQGDSYATHGCDRCCLRKDFPGKFREDDKKNG